MASTSSALARVACSNASTPPQQLKGSSLQLKPAENQLKYQPRTVPIPTFCNSQRTSGVERLRVVCFAKKDKGSSKKGNKKGKSSIPESGGSPAAAPDTSPPYTRGEVIIHSLSIIDSYFRATGKPIFAQPVDVADAAQELWEAPFALVSHGTEEDPIFNYGNKLALEAFEMDWDTLTSLPSRKYAPQTDKEQAARNELLQEAKDSVRELKDLPRVSGSGRGFTIKDGLLWTLKDLDGEVFGQAAIIREYEREGDVGEEAEAGTGQAAAAAAAPAEVNVSIAGAAASTSAVDIL